MLSFSLVGDRMEWEQLLATLDFVKLSKVSNRASEDPREVVMRILNHPFIQAFLLCESICYLKWQK